MSNNRAYIDLFDIPSKHVQSVHNRSASETSFECPSAVNPPSVTNSSTAIGHQYDTCLHVMYGFVCSLLRNANFRHYCAYIVPATGWIKPGGLNWVGKTKLACYGIEWNKFISNHYKSLSIKLR